MVSSFHLYIFLPPTPVWFSFIEVSYQFLAGVPLKYKSGLIISPYYSPHGDKHCIEDILER